MRYEGHASWEELVQSLEHRAEESSSDAERSQLYLEAGKIWGDVLLSNGEAMTRYQLAVKHDPGCTEALHRARDIYVQMGKLGMIGKLIDLQIKTTQEPAKKGELLIEKAWSLMISGKLQAATEALSAAQEEDPDNLVAADLLGDLLNQEDLYAQAVEMEE